MPNIEPQRKVSPKFVCESMHYQLSLLLHEGLLWVCGDTPPDHPFSNHCSFWVAVSSVVLLGIAWAVRRMSSVSCYHANDFLANT